MSPQYLNSYIVVNEQVIYVSNDTRWMKSIRRFKPCLLAKMPHITFGSKLQDSFIAFDLLEGRKTIAEVLA
jgi:hypothetical protein